jgi:hypothetical protein
VLSKLRTPAIIGPFWHDCPLPVAEDEQVSSDRIVREKRNISYVSLFTIINGAVNQLANLGQVWQDASDGITVIFHVDSFDAVAQVMKPKRRRKLSP